MHAFARPRGPRGVRAPGVSGPRSPPLLVRLVQTLVAATGALYVLSVAAAIAAMSLVGERWWPTTVALYLPRYLFALPLPVLAFALALLRLQRHLWGQIVAGLLLLFPLMGLVVRAPVAARRDRPVVRLLSYNVESGGKGYAHIVEEVERMSPDVVFLQEVGGAVDDLLNLLKARFPTVIWNGQFVLATRYVVAEQVDPEKVQFMGRARSPRFMRYLIETPLGAVAFYNVHPISPRGGLAMLHGLRQKILSGQFRISLDPTTLVTETGLREAQVRDFAAAAARETRPVVIAGDTNLPGLSLILHENLSRYQDGFTTAGEGFGYTFPSDKPWMRIDRVLASADLRFVAFRVGRSDASDHHCVVADLQAR